MKRIFLLVAALVANTAFAQSASSVAGSSSGAQSTAITASQATGGNSAAMGGNAAAEAVNGAASAQNSQNITFNSPSEVTTNVAHSGTTNSNVNSTISGTTELRTVATVYAPPVGMTANCMIGASGGATGLGWGFALGTGIEDKGCTRRENARLLHGLGKTVAAARIMCNDPESAAALGPVDCPPPPEPAKPAQ
jgi:hypothetical protein